MSEGIIRHMYPGGNTPRGFHSFYSYIMDPQEARRIFVIKGGPGTGKSTLMRRIGLTLMDLGYDLEFMHCSGDNNSLDGIVVPALKVALLDGTSPHMVDPAHPGAVDEIVNLGQFWKEDGFSQSKNDILNINKKIKERFATAYRYLKAASFLKEDTENIFHSALNKGALALFTQDLTRTLFADVPARKEYGRQRCLFASAITPRGFSDFLDSICRTERIMRLSAPVGSSTRSILEHLTAAALSKGLDVECFYCPMNPDAMEHMVIPERDVSIVTANEYHDLSDLTLCTTYNMAEFYNQSYLDTQYKQMGFNGLYMEALMQRAIETISEAKNAHDELERHYIPNMDFEGINKLRESLTERILSYAKDVGSQEETSQ